MTKEDLMMEAVFVGINIKELKQKFYKFINDKSISLDERWDVFCKLPAYLSETESYEQDFMYITEDEVAEIAQLRDYGIGEIINICEILNDPEDLIELGVNIELSKEKILKANLKSFTNNH